MRRPVLYVAVCAVLMCGFQSPSGDRKNPSRRSTTGSERARSRSLKDASTAAKKPAEVFDEPSRLSREMLVQKLATLQNEFNAQDQAMRINPSQELFVELLQLKENILTIQAELHGATSSEVIEALEWLAEVTFSMRDLDRAEKYQHRLLKVFTQKYDKTEYRVTDAQWTLKTTLSLKTMKAEQVQQFYEANGLSDLGYEKSQTGEYAEAVDYFKRATQLYRATLGEQHPHYATSLNNLAWLYKSMGEYARAEPLYLQSLKIRKQVLGEQHPDYATSLNNLATLYNSMGDHAQAEPLYLQSLAINKTTLGEQHPDYASSLNNLAGLYESMGDYAHAEPLYLQSLAINKTALGEQHPLYANSLSNLAMLYNLMGDYVQAEPLYQQALAIRKQVLGEQHPLYATSLNNLAWLYESMGEYARAEPLYLQALAICKQVLDEQHPDYASSLNNLAVLYVAMGEHAQAEPLMKQVLSIRKQVLGEQHPLYAASLNNLAALYKSMGEYARAEPLYLQALAISKQVLGEQHPNYALSLNGLAGLYESMADYARAEPLYQQVLEIRKQVLGEQHPDYATSLNNLAVLYAAMREYARAEPLLQQVLAINKTALGEQHPDYATSLNNLAFLYKSMGDYAQAESLYRQALQIQTANLHQLVVSQGEARSLVYQNKIIDFQSLLACSRHLNAPDPAVLYAAVTESQGVISQVLRDRHELVLDNPAALEKQQKLRQLQRELSTLVLAVPQPEQIEARQQRLGQLNQQKEDLEQELARLSEPFRRELEVQKTGPAELQRQLNEQQALVHLIMGWDYNEVKQESIPFVDGFVVRRDSLDWVQIPQRESLLELASSWRAALIRGDSDIANQLGVKLREHIWQPIEYKLQGVETIYFVLDGELSFLPYAALPGRESETILLEDYQLATVSHLRELYRQLTDESDSPQSPQFLAMGAVDYDDRSQPAASEILAATSSHRAPVVDRGATLFWNKLPGTGQEVERLAELWTKDDQEQILIGQQANESELRRMMPGQAYVHLATHGFFADEKFRSFLGHDQEHEQLFISRQFTGDNELSRRGPTVTQRNPLLLTGIVCAGANRPAETDEYGLPIGDDGIMTAQEIVSLDLRGTELVVLSACETGLGKVGGGEGVYGLQRAFQLAGARNVLGSLWSVDDAATAALMKLFYTKLWNDKLPPLEAIRQAQLEIYRDPGLIEKLTGQRAPLFEAKENLSRGDLKLNANANKQTSQRRTPARLWAAWTLQGSGI